MDINATTSVICILIAVFALTMYVLADGFDLGLGILLLITKDPDERDELVETIAPIWDGNETWLILATIILFGAFPTAYSILVPAFYLPLLVMLVALGFRGVSIEFRSETRFKHFWDYAFSIGSIVAAFCQGLVAGALLSGNVVVEHERFAGNTLDVFTWFNMLVGLTTVTAYAALGGGWTYWRTEGQLQYLQRLLLRNVLLIFLVLTVLTCTFSIGALRVAQLWSAAPAILIAFAVLSFVLWAMALSSVDGKSDYSPLLFSMGSVAVLLIGYVSVLWPYVVPYNMTYVEAAASRESQLIVIIGTAVMLPVVLGYNAFAYWVFRGKASNVRGE